MCGESLLHFGVLRLNTYPPGICEEKRLDEEKKQIIPKSWFLQLFIHLLFWTRYSDHATKWFFLCVCFHETFSSQVFPCVMNNTAGWLVSF